MKAAIYPGGGQKLTLENLPDPKPGPGDVVIKIHRCGICGTDLHLTSGHKFDFRPGTVLGHEFAGEVVDIGSGVEGFRLGDRITALPSLGCGHCIGCAAGNATLCTGSTPVFGGFAEYLRVPVAAAIKLPSMLSAADGALVEPLAVGLYAARMAGIKAGDRILVLGAGSVALTTIYWARRLGAGRIAAISRAPRRAALAIEMGADSFVQSGETETQDVIEALGGPADIVFECVGVAGQLQRAIEHVRVCGQVLSMGFCIEPETFMPAIASKKGVRLSFPVGYTLRDFQHAADTLHEGGANPAHMISAVVSLDELPDTLDRLRGPNVETKVQVRLG